MNTTLLDTEADHPLLIATSLLTTSLFVVFSLLVLRAEADSVPILMYFGTFVFVLGMGTASVLLGIEGIRRRRQ